MATRREGQDICENLFTGDKLLTPPAKSKYGRQPHRAETMKIPIGPQCYSQFDELSITVLITLVARSNSIKCLRPLEHWDHEFESHSRHGCVFVFILCLY
jgi:hypothetical protein